MTTIPPRAARSKRRTGEAEPRRRLDGRFEAQSQPTSLVSTGWRSAPSKAASTWASWAGSSGGPGLGENAGAEMFGDDFLALYWLTAIAAIVMVVAGPFRSVPARALALGFVAIGIASVVWLIRWFADSCPDQFEFGCKGQQTAIDVIFFVWVGLMLVAIAAVVARAVRR